MSERSTILRHATTVLAGQLAIMAFGVTDTVVAGRYSEQALAALSIGSAVYISVYVALMGILQALLPIWAEQRGAAHSTQLGVSVRQSLYLCLAAGVIGMFILLLIPGVNVIAYIVVALGIAKNFGKSGVFGFFGLVVFSFIGYLILGFGSAQYVGGDKAVTA